MIHSFYVANAGSKKYQDRFSIHQTRVGLGRQTMKLDTPDFHEGELYTKLHVAALAHLHMTKQFPTRKKQKQCNDGTLFEFNTDGLTLEALVKAAKRVAAEQLLACPELALKNGADVARPETWDTVSLHGASLFRHAFIHTELRWAVKQGDPGRMKALFPYLLPIYQSTGKHQYAHEILEVMARYKCEWNADLRATMLGHCLVNETGKTNGWIGIDLWQEHDVRVHKVDFPISDARGEQGADLHQCMSGCLNTLKICKKNIFHDLDIKTSTSKAKDLKSPVHLFTLARDWELHKYTEWRPWRRSEIFQTYPGELKKARPIKGKEDARTISTDPLLNGIQQLIIGRRSLKVFNVRRRGGRGLRDLSKFLEEQFGAFVAEEEEGEDSTEAAG